MFQLSKLLFKRLAIQHKTFYATYSDTIGRSWFFFQQGPFSKELARSKRHDLDTRFEDIEAWQESRILAKYVYDAINRCEEFRKELEILQRTLRVYTKMLADMSAVEDITELEK